MGNTSTIRGKQRNNRNTTEVQKKKKPKRQRFYGNVKYKTKMTTLHDRTTVQINARTFRTEKYTNKQYKMCTRQI